MKHRSGKPIVRKKNMYGGQFILNEITLPDICRLKSGWTCFATPGLHAIN